MAQIFLFFQDRDKNNSRVLLRTAVFLSPAQYAGYLAAIVPVLEGISDAVFTEAIMLEVNNSEDTDPEVNTNINEQAGIVIAQDTDDNYTTLIIPMMSEAAWLTSGPMAGILATAENTAALAAVLGDIGAVSEYNSPIVTESVTIARVA